MKILFDQGTPAPLRRALMSHVVVTAFEKGWSNMANGDLIRVAEAEDFALLITTDKNLRYQQDLVGRRIAVLILWTTNWLAIQRHEATVAAVATAMRPGEFRELDQPE